MERMENYTKVREPRVPGEAKENELRVTTSGRTHALISAALEMLNDKGMNSIKITGLGKTMSKCVSIAEVVKRRVPELHQQVEISSVEMVDVWEPNEGTEGLDKIEKKRMASVLTLILAKGGTGLDKNNPGYQEPVPQDEVTDEIHDIHAEEDATQVGRGKGKGRNATNGLRKKE